MYNAHSDKVLPVEHVLIPITDYIGVTVDVDNVSRVRRTGRLLIDTTGEPGYIKGRLWVRLADVIMECFPGWAKYRGPDRLDCRRENLEVVC